MNHIPMTWSFYNWKCVPPDPCDHFFHLPTPCPATATLSSVSMSFVLFCFFLDCVYKLDCMAFVFLWLISQHNTFKVFPCCCKWQDFFFFNGGVYTICVVCVCICPYTCPHTHAHTYPHYIFFILSSFSGPLGFFHILVLVNAAVLSIGVLGVFIFFQ